MLLYLILLCNIVLLFVLIIIITWNKYFFAICDCCH